jgi:hypothetical protein
MTREEKILKILMLIKEASELMATLEESDNIADAAEVMINTDASPQDIAPDELGCAESVSNIVRSVIPNFPVITGTWTLYDRLNKDSRFDKVSDPQRGDIIISPTGTLANAPFPGHVGILSDYTNIMSNDSNSGEWRQNYTLRTWNARWKAAGYPVYFYRYNGTK